MDEQIKTHIICAKKNVDTISGTVPTVKRIRAATKRPVLWWPSSNTTLTTPPARRTG